MCYWQDSSSSTVFWNYKKEKRRICRKTWVLKNPIQTNTIFFFEIHFSIVEMFALTFPISVVIHYEYEYKNTGLNKVLSTFFLFSIFSLPLWFSLSSLYNLHAVGVLNSTALYESVNFSCYSIIAFEPATFGCAKEKKPSEFVWNFIFFGGSCLKVWCDVKFCLCFILYNIFGLIFWCLCVLCFFSLAGVMGAKERRWTQFDNFWPSHVQQRFEVFARIYCTE